MVRLEGAGSIPAELQLTLYIFASDGLHLAAAAVQDDGRFQITLPPKTPDTLQLQLGPRSDPQRVRHAATYELIVTADDWQTDDDARWLKPNLTVPSPVWQAWRPLRLCVSGRVRQYRWREGEPSLFRPLAYVTVELIEVDREGCWWPYLRRRWPEILDRPFLRLHDLVHERPFPPPPQLPGPTIRDSRPPRAGADLPDMPARRERNGHTGRIDPEHSAMPTGEMRHLDPAIADRLSQLTLTSRQPPWVIYPRCFHQIELLGETHTDCDGLFRLCFDWWPFYLRRGRLRDDGRPDLILRITQTVNGIKRILYLDPYTSTRWNNGNSFLDLTLDDEAFYSSDGCRPNRLSRSMAALTAIGSDPVACVDRATGYFHVGQIDNVAYGGVLNIQGRFSPDLSRGAPAYYYRLSYAPADSQVFTAIDTPLIDFRASLTGGRSYDFRPYLLGPKMVGGQSGLFEVRDRANFLWLGSGQGGIDLIGIWNTLAAETDHGLYVLRLELFDADGRPVTDVGFVDRSGNGSGEPPASPTVVSGRLDLKIALDNQPVTIGLNLPTGNAYGVVTWSPSLELNFDLRARQQNGRLHGWQLAFNRGADPTEYVLASDTYDTGLEELLANISGGPLLEDPASNSGRLERTCTFRIVLRAWAHVRGNHGYLYAGERSSTLAIEKYPTAFDARRA